jgi:gamma-butyrobetaine dioxygenase
MDPADVSRAYRAAKRFHQLAADPRFQIRYPFRPGDLIGFDNRRMLHGRDAFDAGTGVRHLRGTYIDHDEIHSRLRVLRRHTHPTDSAPDGPGSIENGCGSASTENHDKEFAP